MIFDIVVVGAVLQMAGSAARELASKFPTVSPLPGAVRKEFQSFRFGMINLGGCIHVAVDELHLHLQPAWFARRMIGMKAASVPWEAIRVDDAAWTKRRGWKRSVRLKIGSLDVTGPAWAMEILKPEA